MKPDDEPDSLESDSSRKDDLPLGANALDPDAYRNTVTIARAVHEILAASSRKSCIRSDLPEKVSKYLQVPFRRKRRQQYRRLVGEVISLMRRKGIVEEYRTQHHRRVHLVEQYQDGLDDATIGKLRVRRFDPTNPTPKQQLLLRILKRLDLQPDPTDISAGDHFSNAALERIDAALSGRGRPQQQEFSFEPDEEMQHIRSLPDIPETMYSSDSTEEPAIETQCGDALDADEIDRKLRTLVGEGDEDELDEDDEPSFEEARETSFSDRERLSIRDLRNELWKQLLRRPNIATLDLLSDGLSATIENPGQDNPLFVEVRLTAETRMMIVSVSSELPTKTIEDNAVEILHMFEEFRYFGSVFAAPMRRAT